MTTNGLSDDVLYRFVAALPDGPELEWLKLSLSDLGTVIPAGSENLDAVMGVLDLSDAPILFVGISRENTARASTLIEGVLASRPLLTVVAVGDGVSQDELLAAMRAGARDFITVGSRASEVRALVRRSLERSPLERADPTARAQVLATINARPGVDNAFFASHLALTVNEAVPEASVVLVDLGLPPADSLALLGMESNFTFFDAMRNVRRMDPTLLETALSRHASGIQVLSMPEDQAAEDVSTTELHLLLGALRRHFTHVIVNLGGLPDGEFLRSMLNNADHVFQVVDQTVPSCRQNQRLLERMREGGTHVQSLGIVVDRYLPRAAPEAATVASRLGAPLVGTLRSNPGLRLRAINLGKSLFELAPGDRYLKTLRQLVDRTLGSTSLERRGSWGLVFRRRS
ncbi:pilus assembly protein CpaE [Thioalkalivibrio sp. ALE28]|uniref:AAA family ATPase n=1 Tax=Thioalkalivibrio sp. ALE28 TaxID=1158179 RepID=UPI00039A7189|nr:pilus assembly protein CpaE [Thioalkalivibrio sp. ALE28]